MLEKIFLRKEIVTEVEDNWKLPAQIIIHALHIQVGIWGDAYSEQALIQKSDEARVWQRAWGAGRALARHSNPRTERRQVLQWPDVAQSNSGMTSSTCFSPPSQALRWNPAHKSQTPSFARLFCIKNASFVTTWAHLYKYCCLPTELMLSIHLHFCINLIFTPYSLSKLTYLITLFFGSTEYHLLVSVNVKTYCSFLFFWHVLCIYKAKWNHQMRTGSVTSYS